MTMSRRRLAVPSAFLAVSMADLMLCQVMNGLGLRDGIWLLNLPATITAGRLGTLAGGPLLGLCLTITAGAAIYGWVAARAMSLHLARQRAGRRNEPA